MPATPKPKKPGPARKHTPEPATEISIVSKPKYRDEDGMRLQVYRRFKEGVHYEPIDKEQMNALIEFAQHCHRLHRSGHRPDYSNLEVFLGVIDAYWDVLAEKNRDGVKIIPDIEGFCCFAGISRDTLFDWERSKPPAYIDTIKTLKNMIAYSKKQMALSGKIPPLVFATDFNNNHGYTQKQEVILTPNNPLGDITNSEELRQRYLEASTETTE